MKKIGLTLFAIATLGASTMVMNTAQAAPVAVSGQLGAAADSLSLIEKTQFTYGGRRYCWYDEGWHGPGWYRCGYALRRGFGWGGSSGWHRIRIRIQFTAPDRVIIRLLITLSEHLFTLLSEQALL